MLFLSSLAADCPSRRTGRSLQSMAVGWAEAPLPLPAPQLCARSDFPQNIFLLGKLLLCQRVKTFLHLLAL